MAPVVWALLVFILHWMRNLPDYDPLSCGYGSTHQPHDLIEISDMIMTRSGAFYIEDNINPEIECNAQYVSMRNSAISQCSATKDRASVFFSARDQFRTIQATFENVSLSAPFGKFQGAVLLRQVLSVTFTNCTFENNQMTAIRALASNLIFEGGNTFRNNFGSAIKALASNLIFQGENTFRNNFAHDGGGIVLFEDYIFLNHHTHIFFADNHANNTGGAIYVLRSGRNEFQDFHCFFQADLDYNDIEIEFSNNTAGIAGSSLYIPIPVTQK